MHVLAQDTAGWQAGYTVGVIVVIAVVALAVPILLLARLIGKQAKEINESLQESVTNTAALAGLSVTIDSAEAITAGLRRGRIKLGG
jgi:cell shape-determining protein MreD